jgi:hypothetical protein
MRLIQVIVHLYDKKKAEITGDAEDTSNDVPRKCAIDLDEIAAIWEAFDEGIIVSIKSGERFWIKDGVYEDMFHRWQGTCTDLVQHTGGPSINENIFDDDMKKLLG